MIVACFCGWTGVPTYLPERRVRPKYVVNPKTGRVEVQKSRGSAIPYAKCPACKQPIRLTTRKDQ